MEASESEAGFWKCVDHGSGGILSLVKVHSWRDFVGSM